MPAVSRVLVSQSIVNALVDSSKGVYGIFKGDPSAAVCLQLFARNESSDIPGTYRGSHNALQIIEIGVMSSFKDVGSQCDMKVPPWGFFAQHLVKLVPKIFKDSEVTFREAGIHECVMACHVYASLARGCRFS